MTDLSPDFVGRVDRLSLRPTAENALMPLFEAISNSLHAVDDRFGQRVTEKSLIQIRVLRADFSQEKSPVVGFVIEDNGIGLDNANFNSFRRLDSRHKVERGGKGIGRLGWLKVFQHIEVDSTYFEGGQTRRRSFDFQLTETNQMADHEPREVCPTGGGTRIYMYDYTPVFMNKCPADPEVILQRLAQHFLNVFVAENPISVLVEDGSLNVNLASYVQEHVQANNLDAIKLQLEYLTEPQDFVIRHLKISRRFKPPKGHNRLLMFGNDRCAN
jgi:hypothetical protein